MGITWFGHLTKRLESMGFTQGLVDPCLFFRKEVEIVVYERDDLYVATQNILVTKLLSFLTIFSQVMFSQKYTSTTTCNQL